jgi:hypothetical protein
VCHSPSSSVIVTRSFTLRTYIDLSLSNNFPYTASVQSSPCSKEEEEGKEEGKEEEEQKMSIQKRFAVPQQEKKEKKLVPSSTHPKLFHECVALVLQSIDKMLH